MEPLKDLENLRYNTAIAALMEYTNGIQKAEISSRQDIKTLLILMAPFAPHLTEELWEQLGQKDSIHNQSWPTYDEGRIQEDKIQLIIQVNGKLRDVAEVSRGITEGDAKSLAMESEKVKKWLGQKKPKKIIFVKGKLINIVT